MSYHGAVAAARAAGQRKGADVEPRPLVQGPGSKRLSTPASTKHPRTDVQAIPYKRLLLVVRRRHQRRKVLPAAHRVGWPAPSCASRTARYLNHLGCPERPPAAGVRASAQFASALAAPPPRVNADLAERPGATSPTGSADGRRSGSPPRRSLTTRPQSRHADTRNSTDGYRVTLDSAPSVRSHCLLDRYRSPPFWQHSHRPQSW